MAEIIDIANALFTNKDKWSTITDEDKEKFFSIFNRYFSKKYDGKKILGNTKKGDGYLYRGRGYIQLTGRDNYTRVGRALGIDLVNHPELAADPKTAAKIAVYFWQKRVVPQVGDFSQANVRDVTRGINPAQRGLEKRQAQFMKVAQR